MAAAKQLTRGRPANIDPGLEPFSIGAGSDSSDHNARGLYIGSGGDVVVLTGGGNTITFKSVPTGTILPVFAYRVKQTGTTASSIIGLDGALGNGG
jgi:hypothetical protein